LSQHAENQRAAWLGSFPDPMPVWGLLDSGSEAVNRLRAASQLKISRKLSACLHAFPLHN